MYRCAKWFTFFPISTPQSLQEIKKNMEQIDSKNINVMVRIGCHEGSSHLSAPTTTGRDYHDFQGNIDDVIKELYSFTSVWQVMSYLKRDGNTKRFHGGDDLFLSKEANKPKNIDGVDWYVRHIFLFVKNDNEQTVSCKYKMYISK